MGPKIRLGKVGETMMATETKATTLVEELELLAPMAMAETEEAEMVEATIADMLQNVRMICSLRTRFGMLHRAS